MKFNSNKGFTLIELLVVISVIGLLSSVVLAATSTARDRATLASALTFDDHTYHAFGADAVAIWNFDDPTNLGKDSSGNGNDLSFGGGVSTADPNGAKGGGLKICTTLGDYGCSINYPYISPISGMKGFNTINPSTGSVSMWVKFDSIPALGTMYIFSLGNIVTERLAYIVTTNTLSPALRGTGIFTNVISPLKTNIWTHFTISWDSAAPTGSKALVYINGKIVANYAGINSPFILTDGTYLTMFFGVHLIQII